MSTGFGGTTSNPSIIRSHSIDWQYVCCNHLEGGVCQVEEFELKIIKKDWRSASTGQPIYSAQSRPSLRHTVPHPTPSFPAFALSERKDFSAAGTRTEISKTRQSSGQFGVSGDGGDG